MGVLAELLGELTSFCATARTIVLNLPGKISQTEMEE